VELITFISAIVHTLNEEKMIAACLDSLFWVDEIIVIDMHSDDKTVDLARKYTNKIFYHERVGYVEPARNFGISKATGDYILILDADERISPGLVGKLKNIAYSDKYDVVSIPRKNIIFGRWVRHTGWWPDSQQRFFKKGHIKWKNTIHSLPEASGRIFYMETVPENAIIHFNYANELAFIRRMKKYTDIEARNMHESNIRFNWKSMFISSKNEFISRYFKCKGFRDGRVGLELSILMGIYRIMSYLKLRDIERSELLLIKH
jgi:glycosyltransferase involved in cell wall biosynthesis